MADVSAPSRRGGGVPARVAVAGALTVACGVLVLLVPAVLAGSDQSWVVGAMDALLVLNALTYGLVGPWAYLRAAQALWPDPSRSRLGRARRLAAAGGTAYGALAVTLWVAVVVGSATIGTLGVPMTLHLLTLVVFGPLAVLTGVLSLLLGAVDASTRQSDVPAGGLQIVKQPSRSSTVPASRASKPSGPAGRQAATAKPSSRSGAAAQPQSG